MAGALATLAMGCTSTTGDEWLQGTFSDLEVPHAEYGVESVRRYEFRPTGVLVVNDVRDCTEHNESGFQPVGRWRHRGDDTVEVEVDEPYDVRYWRFSPAEPDPDASSDDDFCNRIHWDAVSSEGEVTQTSWLFRGDVCMSDENVPCYDESVCPRCVTVWCDEPPPPCE
jgi:hypothetical protein